MGAREIRCGKPRLEIREMRRHLEWISSKKSGKKMDLELITKKDAKGREYLNSIHGGLELDEDNFYSALPEIYSRILNLVNKMEQRGENPTHFTLDCTGIDWEYHSERHATMRCAYFINIFGEK